MNGGKLPEHVVPFCVGGALLAAAVPLVSDLLQRILQQLDCHAQSAKASDDTPRPSRLSRVSGPGDEDVRGPSGVVRWRRHSLRAAIWLLPSGIGFAVGMYVSPKWTIPRVIGSAIEQGWLRVNARTHRSLMVIIASGLVLGEGVASILNAAFSAACKHHSCAKVFG